jgi:hypothetical protein
VNYLPDCLCLYWTKSRIMILKFCCCICILFVHCNNFAMEFPVIWCEW